MVGYGQKPVGLTKDTGWQIGARRTYAIGLDQAWRLITSEEGVRIWLGEGSTQDWTKGSTYELADGTTGELRVFKPNSHLRITFFPTGWPRSSTIQVRAIPSGEKTQISFHQEHLPGPEEREARKRYFREAHDRLASLIDAGDE